MNLSASRTKGHGLLTALLFPLLLMLSFGADAQDIQVKAGERKDFVSEVLPWPLEHVHERAAAMFSSEARDYYDDYNAKIYQLPEPVGDYKKLSPGAYKNFLAMPLVRPNKFYVFYGAYPLVQNTLRNITPLSAMGHTNAALQRYAKLSESERAHDLYVWSPDSPYWHSEYALDGKKLPFKTYFIVHMTREDDAHTNVEIIENEPVVRINGKSSVDIHGKLRSYTLREVEPTTSDREFLLSCIRQFIERKVPGRHWFSCRAKGEIVQQPIPFTVP